MNFCNFGVASEEPAKVFFPTPTDPTALTLRDGLVYKRKYDVTLTQPGYYAISLSNKTEPAWDAFFLGFSNMRVECQYILEPPSDASQTDPSWCASASAVLRSSISGLMRMVSDTARGTGRDAIIPQSLTDGEAKGHAAGLQERDSSGAASPWHPPQSPKMPNIPSKVLADVLQKAAEQALGDKKSPERSASSPRDHGKEKGQEKGKERPAAPPAQEAASGDTTEAKGTPRGSEGWQERERPDGTDEGKGADQGRSGSPAPSGEKVQGVSMDGLFTESPQEKASASPLEAASFHVSPESKERPSSIQHEGEAPTSPAAESSKEGGDKTTNKPQTDEAEMPEESEKSSSHSRQTDDKKPSEPTDASRGQSKETSTIEKSTSSKEQPEGDDVTEGEGRLPLLQEEASHSAAPRDREHEVTTLVSCEHKDTKGDQKEDEGRQHRREGATDQLAKSPSSGKLSLRALTLLSLQSRLLRMASSNRATGDWGGIEIFGGIIPAAKETPEEEMGELREDVLFYEAEGHYTDTGEEYCLPLGEQQQLVKFVTENVISVRAKKRKFSFVFVPAVGSHLMVELRASRSLGMSLFAHVELVYCGAPPPLYKALPILFVSADKKCVLSLDGAGIYAAIGQLMMLRQLEKEVRFLVGDRRLNVACCFDLLVGTGIGGLLSLALLQGSTVASLLKEWAGVTGKNLDQLTPEWRGSFFMQILAGIQPKILRSDLVDKFGWRFLNTFNAPLGVITCSDVAQNPPQPFVFRTYEHTSPANHVRSHRGTSRCPLWLAAWATIASPGTLRAIKPEDFASMGFSVEPKVSLMGATTADALAANPTLAGLDECARLVHKQLRNFIHGDEAALRAVVVQSDLQLLVSFGARECFGSPPTRQGPLEPFATEGLTAATTCAHREALHWLADRLDVYFRFNMPLLRGVRLIPGESRGLMDLMAIALEYITDEKFFELKKAAKILAYHYKNRVDEQSRT